jgi:hypothetical protein
MALIATPFMPFGLSDENATKLLEGLVNLPNTVSVPCNNGERKVFLAGVITDPSNRAWTVWHGSDLMGMLLLTNITPNVDALCHFAFFDRQLFGRKALIWNMIGVIFKELQLRRISVEIPEYLAPLIRFVRSKLHFKYEGEGLTSAEAARIGARREQAFWRSDTEEWVDYVRMRLLKTEYLQHVNQPQSSSS